MTQEQKKIALAFISLSASFSPKIALSIIETHTIFKFLYLPAADVSLYIVLKRIKEVEGEDI